MTLDTLAINRKLRAAGFNRKQAEALVSIFSSAEGHAATIENLKATEGALRKDLKSTEVALRKDLESTEGALRKDLESAEGALRKEIKRVEERLESKIESLQQKLTVRMYGAVATATAILVAAQRLG